jgi:hypothetical protein
MGNACAIYKDVRGFNQLKYFHHLLLIRYVTQVNSDLTPTLRYGICCLVCILTVQVNQVHMCSLGGKQFGYRFANPAASARDYGIFIFQCKHAALLDPQYIT